MFAEEKIPALMQAPFHKYSRRGPAFDLSKSRYTSARESARETCTTVQVYVHAHHERNVMVVCM